jgi:hypothetical protein
MNQMGLARPRIAMYYRQNFTMTRLYEFVEKPLFVQQLLRFVVTNVFDGGMSSEEIIDIISI